MYIKNNNIGPRTEPCGTPAVTFAHEECLPLIITRLTHITHIKLSLFTYIKQYIQVKYARPLLI